VVQRAGGQPFDEQVRERISGPLGMVDFRPDYQWEEIPNRAAGYRRVGEKIVRRPADQDPDVSWKLGGGGYTSPATDLARFGIGLLKGGLVSEETEREMWTVVRPENPEGARPYGLGFAISRRPDGGRLIGHTGSQEKTRTALLIDPATGQGVAVMTNSEWAEPMKVATGVMAAIRGR
jgi:CubicO group peptidase (beta-lactamase class C family)